MADWESGDPIATMDSTTFNGSWVPAVEIFQNDIDPDGNASQKFILSDGTPNGRFPVDRTGPAIDLSDPQTLIDEWARINKRPDDGGGD